MFPAKFLKNIYNIPKCYESPELLENNSVEKGRKTKNYIFQDFSKIFHDFWGSGSLRRDRLSSGR